MTDVPLPPRTSDMNVQPLDHFKPLDVDSFHSLPGLEGFEVRDLQIGVLNGGRAGVQIFRAAKEPMPGPGIWHMHDLDIQIGYIIRGWVLYEFDGSGEVKAEAGTVINHMPRCRLRILDRSPDYEGIWVKSPSHDVVTAFPYDEASGTFVPLTISQET